MAGISYCQIMKDIFDIDKKELKKFIKFAKKSPKEFSRATANVLNSLAFKTRENDIDEITQSMTVRNSRFVKSSLRVQMAKGSRIDSMIAVAYSVNRNGFSGWKEQQEGGPPMKRNIHPSARGGNQRARVKSRYRLKPGNKFHRPSDYPGKTDQSQFYAMLRILATRGGGEFILTDNQPLKNGMMEAGLYSFKKRRITRLQTLDTKSNVRRNEWRTRSIKKLVSNDKLLEDLWRDAIKRVIKQSGLRK